jgi:hypothetical protein
VTRAEVTRAEVAGVGLAAGAWGAPIRLRDSRKRRKHVYAVYMIAESENMLRRVRSPCLAANPAPLEAPALDLIGRESGSARSAWARIVPSRPPAA